MDRFTPPYYGAAYYPEAWDPKELDRDIRRMKDLGVNVVRIAEFAWAFMEPQEGQYKLEWLHRVVRELGEAGIAVVMCTPTATPPAWLTKKYPQTLSEMVTGQKYSHGGRRHYCPNSHVYRDFSRKITAQLAKEFFKYRQVVAWQLDNEFACHTNSCFCETCEREFQHFMKRMFGTIENLNQTLGTGVWSIRFSSFEEIPAPKPTPAGHHPSLLFYYKYFMSHSFSDFAREQVKIIRRYTPAPITTNGMPPFHELDYEDLFSNLDFACNDLYWPPEEIWKWCPELDWMRPMKKKPYWVMETSATGGGGNIPGAVYIHDPGAMRAKNWLAFAQGGEAVLFWLWRSHWAGHEMEHGSLTYAWGEPTLAEAQFRQVSKELEKAKTFLNGTFVEKPRLAVHFSYPSMWVFNQGALVWNFNYNNAWNDSYKLLLDSGIQRDVIYPNSEIADNYKVVFSPYMAIIPRRQVKRMEEFMAAGGTWIIGPMTSFRNEHAAAFKDCAYGPLEKLMGAHVRHRFISSAKGGKLNFSGYKKAACTWWCDAFIPEKGTKAVASYADGPAKGLAAVIERKIGKGKIIVMGTQVNKEVLASWLPKEIRKCAPARSPAPAGIVVSSRVNEKGGAEGVIAVDIAGKGGKVSLAKGGTDLLTGKKAKSSVTLAPYGVAVIKY